MNLIQRDGVDHDPVRPWMWASMPLRPDPVEIVSYPIPHEDSSDEIDDRATVMVRLRVGDPTSIHEVPLKNLACFSSDRHEWHVRPRRYYSDNPTAFVFTDE